jgi:hypothetical protein
MVNFFYINNSTDEKPKNKIFYCFIFPFNSCFSQTGGVGIGYQAVIYKPDSSNPGVAISSSPLSNTTICLRFTLLDETKIMGIKKR